MKLELEVGTNLRMMVEEFCVHCDNRNDIIIIKDNLEEVMNKIGFEPEESKRFAKLYSGTQQTVFAIWTDDDGQEYATIDLCVEIPLQCCEPYNKPELLLGGCIGCGGCCFVK